MRGAVVINAYLDGPSFKEPAEMMAAAGDARGVGVDTFLNTELSAAVGDEKVLSDRLRDVDFIVFWDKDIMLAKNLEICGYPVFNCSECIRMCDDKSLTHLVLEEWGIPSIRTMISPQSFGRPYEDWIPNVMDNLEFPIVVKDIYGSFGQQVRLVRDRESLIKEGSSGSPKIFQEYLEVGSQDIRLEVVGDEVVAAVRRKAAEGDFRANASNGGTMSVYEPTGEEKEMAVDAASAVQASFLGVDILQTDDGPVVCELNSNAHIRNLTDCTKIDVAGRIMEYIQAFLR